MDSLLISIGSLIVGAIVTIWVSSYYFRRSRRKSLTPFIQFSTSVFRGVDPSLRDSLKIDYKGTPVTDLFEIRFLIANNGERPIRDLISPLTLQAPEDALILDATLLHIHPEGRDVSIMAQEKEVIFNFPLLNSQEFFICKLLLQGSPHPFDFKFTISVDELPPSLKPRSLSPDLIESGAERGFSTGTLIAGLVVFLFGASMAYLSYAQWPIVSETFSTSGYIETFKLHWIALVSMVVLILPTILLLVAAPMLVIGAFGNFSIPRRKRFRVPAPYRRFPIRRVRPGYPDEEEWTMIE